MDFRSQPHVEQRSHGPIEVSPVVSDRVRCLATRAIEGAPVFTAGEVRELAKAVIVHNEQFA